jgi:crossover junction endodeoxyribonuclease RuvC
MRVLGVDPGLTRCGIGVVEGSVGRPLSLVHVSVLRTPATDELGDRLLSIAEGIEAAVAEFRPDAVVVERVFAQQNLRSVTGTAQASGLALVAAKRLGIRVAMHTPTEVKASITGSGTADKAQVTAMVMRILKLTTRPTPADAADALALAICHIWRGSAVALRAEAAARATGSAAAQASGSHLRGPGSETARRLTAAARGEAPSHRPFGTPPAKPDLRVIASRFEVVVDQSDPAKETDR